MLLIEQQPAPAERRELSLKIGYMSLGDEGERWQISHTRRFKQFVKPFFGGYLRNPSEDPFGLGVVG